MPTPEQQRQILHALATTHPDFADFVNHCTFTPNHELSAELLNDTLAFLHEDPDQAIILDAIQQQADSYRNFHIDVETISTIVAVMFLLRTHIKLKRNEHGKWTFLLENKPNNNSLLSNLLEKLNEWLGH
jgi:hypothetical protein